VAREATPKAAVAATVLVIAGAVTFRWWAERRIVGPWYLDEFEYAYSARAIADDWALLVHHFGRLFYLYPRLLSPAWAAAPISTAYAIAKGINVVLITSALIPIYLWVRRISSAWWTALAVALVAALPTGLYGGVLVTENAFFPAFTLACFLLAYTLERPTIARQALAAGAIALACAVRLQGIVFVAIVPSAIVLKAVFDGRQTRERLSWSFFWRRIRAYVVLLLLLALGAVLYALRQVLGGEHLSGGLGIYAFVVRIHDYSAPDVLKWIVYHFAGIGLAVAFLPLIALVLLVGEAWQRDGRMTPAERALVAVTLSAVVWLVVQVGIFASHWSERMSERYMFHAEALLLLAFVMWVSRGTPRPRRWLVPAVGIPLALVLALPLQQLLANPGILSDAFSLVALDRLAPHVGGGHALRWIVVGATAVVGGAVTLAPRRLIVPLAPAIVLCSLVAMSLAVPGPLTAYARSLRGGAGIVRPSWIDKAVGRRATVDLVYTGDPEPDRSVMTMLQTEFWNQSVRMVDLLTPIFLCCIPQRRGEIDVANGSIRVPAKPAEPPRFVVAFPPLGELAGTRVASANGLTLVRAANPLRLASETSGVYSDGWTGASATYDRFTGSRRVRVVVSRAAWAGPDVPGHVELTIGPLQRTVGSPRLARIAQRLRWTVHRGKTKTFVLHAPAEPYRVAVQLSPTFSPSDYGFGDARRLGAQVAFRPMPG
jgi:hypothetical protein